MKVIFLDIDGVLIKFENANKARKTRAEKNKGVMITEFENELVENLVNLVIQTSSVIVISSSWRRSSSLMKELRGQFYNYPIPNKYVDVDLWRRVISKTPHSLGNGRGNEILSWINKYHETCKTGDHIKKWVVLDDNNIDMKVIKNLGRFVHTKTNEGLTKDKMNEAIKILNGSI